MIEGGSAISRILLALGASPRDFADCEAVAELAASLNAELCALFVEDINLLRLASLPFSRETGRFSAVERPLDLSEVERMLRAEAARAERLLAEAAESRGVRHSFRTARGRMVAQAMEVFQEVDLIVFGAVGMETERAAPAPARRPFARRNPVLVWYDGTPRALRAFSAALELAQFAGGALTVLLPAEHAAAAQRQAETLLQGRMPGVRFRPLPAPDAASLAAAANGEGAGVLVLDGGETTEETASRLLDEITCPLVLVR